MAALAATVAGVRGGGGGGGEYKSQEKEGGSEIEKRKENKGEEGWNKRGWKGKGKRKGRVKRSGDGGVEESKVDWMYRVHKIYIFTLIPHNYNFRYTYSFVFAKNITQQ